MTLRLKEVESRTVLGSVKSRAIIDDIHFHKGILHPDGMGVLQGEEVQQLVRLKKVEGYTYFKAVGFLISYRRNC